MSGGKATISVQVAMNSRIFQGRCIVRPQLLANKQQLPAPTNSVRNCKLNAWFWALHKQEEWSQFGCCVTVYLQ